MYSETVNVSGMSKDELFTKVSLWSAEAFKGPENTPFTVTEKSKVLSADRGQMLIAAHLTGVIKYPYSGSDFFISVHSNVTIALGDERYQITFEVDGVQHAVYMNNWIYSKKYPASHVGKYLYKDANSLNITKDMWRQLADALRTTVSGTIVGG